MDFELKFTPEQELFRSEVRSWLANNVPRNLDSPADPSQLTYRDYQKLRSLGRKLGKKGWLYPTYPREYGGGSHSEEEALVLVQEMDRLRLNLPPYYDTGGKLGAASIMVWGTDDQKNRFLPPILKGQVRTWQLLSEPEAGSDLANVKTTALLDGADYVINGQKIFVGSTHGAEWSWMIVNTNPDGKRHDNLSWFVIPMDIPGITCAPMDLLFSGNERGASSGTKQTVYFENVRVPASNLIGGVNNGWRVAGTHLELEHGLMQTSLTGDDILARLFRICKQTTNNGQVLSQYDSVRNLLVDMFMDAEIGRLLHIRNYWMQSTRRTLSYEGPQAYLHMKRSALRTSKAIHNILGPYALTLDPERTLEEGHIEAQQRGSIVAQHPGGTVEIQKLIMARRLGLGKAAPEQAGRIR